MDFEQDYPECLSNLHQRWEKLNPMIQNLVQSRIRKSGKSTRDLNNMDSWQKTLDEVKQGKNTFDSY